MPKKPKKAKPIPVKDPQHVAAVPRVILHILAAVIFCGLLAAGFYKMKKYVERDVVYPDRPPKVVMKNRPAWMTDALALQITSSVRPAGVHSAFDRQLLVDTAAILQNNPWVKKVIEVRRAYDQKPADTLEIDCEYRAPIALIHWKDYFWLVDDEAVKLPEQFTAAQLPGVIMGPDQHLNIRIIEGITEPPVESGKKWTGEDIAAGLDMVKLLYGKEYADEIIKVDLSNFAGRISKTDAQISLLTKYNTAIRWGQPLNAKDFFVEVPTSQKLQALADIYAKYHRVDGGKAWIDIRFDRITQPSEQGTADVTEPR